MGGAYWVKGLVSRYELESGLSWICRKEDHVREALTKGIWSRRAAGQLSPLLLNTALIGLSLLKVGIRWNGTNKKVCLFK